MNRQLDSIALKYREKILISICWLSAILAFLIAMIRIMYFGVVDLNIISLFVLGAIFIALKSYQAKKHKTEHVVLIIHTLLFVGIPVRIYFSGGSLSPNWFLYLFHCVFAFGLKGQRNGYLTLFWSCLNLGLFGLYSSFFSLPDSPYYENFLNHGIALFTCMGITIFPLLFMYREKEEIYSAIRQLEHLERRYLFATEALRNIKENVRESLGSFEKVDEDDLHTGARLDELIHELKGDSIQREL